MIDMFGLELNLNDEVAVFQDGEPGYTETKETLYRLGKIKDIEEFPTGLGRVTVEYFIYDEKTRREHRREIGKSINDVTTSVYWAHSVFKFGVLREVVPEHFL